MKNKKKTLSKTIFEATYVANDSEEIKKLKSSGIIQPDDVVKLDTNQEQQTISEESPEAKEEMYAEYLSNMTDEKPFMVHDDKYEYVWAKYPDGKRDIGVYKFAGDYVLSYKWFRKHVLRANDGVNEEELTETTVNVDKLKKDVDILINQKMNLASIQPYLDKIDKPIEQAEFIAAIAEKIGVPRTRLASIIGSLKDIANVNTDNSSDAIEESAKPRLTKKELIETVVNIVKPKLITTLKKKDIK